MKNRKYRPIFVVSCAVLLSGCASLKGDGVVKAPCSPTAGLTDPCGNRMPINTLEDITKTLEDIKTLGASDKAV